MAVAGGEGEGEDGSGGWRCRRKERVVAAGSEGEGEEWQRQLG